MMPIQAFRGGYFDLGATFLWAFLFMVVFLFCALFCALCVRGRLQAGARSSERMKKALRIMILAAVLVRFGYVWSAAPRGVELIDGFYQRAVGMVHGLGFSNSFGKPTALWMPGASLLYGMALCIFGDSSYRALLATQLLLGFLSMGIVYLFARLVFDEITGLLAAVLLGFIPSQIVLGTFGMSDLAFMVSLWGGVTAFAYAVSHNRGHTPFTIDCARTAKAKICLRLNRPWGWTLISGFLFGFCSLTRPYGFFLMALYFLWILFAGWKYGDRRELTRRAIPAACVTAMTCFFLSFWVNRNAHVFHRFVPFTTSDGINLWMANHPGASGKLEYTGDRYSLVATIPSPEKELEESDRLKREAVAYLKGNPGVFLRKIPRKWGLLLGSDTTYIGVVLKNEFRLQNSFLKNLLGGIGNGYYLILFVLAFLFCAARFRSLLRDPAGCFGPILFFSLLALFSVFHIETRFHMPLLPALSIYAAAFVRSRILSEDRSTALNLVGKKEAR